MNIFKIIEKKCCQRGRESVQNNLNTKSVRYNIDDIPSRTRITKKRLTDYNPIFIHFYYLHKTY